MRFSNAFFSALSASFLCVLCGKKLLTQSSLRIRAEIAEKILGIKLSELANRLLAVGGSAGG